MIFDRYLTTALDDALRNSLSVTSGLSLPTDAEVKNLPDEYSITIEVPGCSADDVAVTTHGSVLKVSGKSRHGKSFESSYRLSKSYDDSKITAKVKDGLLEISVPKSNAVKPREIKVTS